MTAHILFDNEIQSCRDAAGRLFEASDHGAKARSDYQEIVHILDWCKTTRFLKSDGGIYE